eukprot:m.835152 g.835152  ORF g.835152 m.835152 type:complete len:85 (+) comp23452_c0_seq20:2820-3074(+)
MRVTLWDIYMAGGGAVWYNCDMSWDVIRQYTPRGFDYVHHLAAFWRGTAFWTLSEHNALVTVEYVRDRGICCTVGADGWLFRCG